MRDLYVVTGRLSEVHRFINVPLHWFEEYPARERRELWIATPEGREIKLVVHSRQMPARCGHQVDALVSHGDLVGLANATTGAEVNYARADPPLLWRRADSALVAIISMIAFASCVIGSATVGLMVAVGVLGATPAVLFARLARNVRERKGVDQALERLADFRSPRALLRRVK